MTKYRVTFECGVNIEAINASEAIKKAWLVESLKNATYKYKDVKLLPDTIKEK